MPATQQLPLHPDYEAQTRPVEYVPPDIDTIRQYAQKVCKRLSETDGQKCSSTDFTHGLTNFLQVVVNIETRHRNRGVKNVQ